MNQTEPDTGLTAAGRPAAIESSRAPSTVEPEAAEFVTAAAIAKEDSRIVLALDEYSAAVHAGQTPDRIEFQSRYPDVAEALGECLEGLEFVRAAAPQLRHRAADQVPGSVPLAEFWPADALGDYRIVRELGRGGMGVVYEVVQVSLGRRVALKVLPFAAALDAKQLQRFKNEAQAAAQLHHQNIVPVYGVGCERGVHYYAMQFIDGQTLAALIAELRPPAGPGRRPPAAVTPGTITLAGELLSGRWAPAPRDGDLQATASFRPSADSSEASSGSVGAGSAPATTQALAVVSTENSTKSPAFFRTVANLGMQAAAALEHAHAQGVVHRDIKPANLLIDSRGNLWITDFGLAHCQNQAELTMTGDLMGTLRYMSPEQTLAQRALLDHRTDIYSLGATLYELLTLQPVFDGRDRQELMRQITLEEPRPPRSINAAIPAELETIVLKAMEKSPAERYATAQDLADDLQRYLKDEPIRAKPPTLSHKLKKWTRRHIGVVRTALGMLALLLLAVAAVASLAAWSLNNERAVTSNQLRLTRRAEAEATLRLYRSLVEQARANRLARRMGQRFRTLDVLKEAAQTARGLVLDDHDTRELRNEAIACLALPDLQVAHEWQGWPSGSMTLDFDAALRLYARTDRQGMVHVCRVGTGQTLHTIRAFGPGDFGPGEETWLLFSPDGRFLQLHRGDRMKVYDLAGASPAVVLETIGTRHAASFSPDSRELATARADGSIELYSLTTGDAARPVAMYPDVSAIAFHPHRRRLALSSPGGIQVCEIDARGIQASLPGSAGAERVVWHPSGDRIAAVMGRDVVVWDVGSGRALVRMAGHSDGGVNAAYNHVGDLLATSSWGGEVRLWNARDGRLLFSSQAGAGLLRFSLDDGLLAVGRRDDALQLWKVGLPQGYRTLAQHADSGGDSYHSCSISPKLPLLAVGMEEGIGFWHATRGDPLAFMARAGFRHVLFEPSGELLASGPEGMFRWPVREDPTDSGTLRIGPPTKLLPGTLGNLAISRDGRVIASAQGWGGMARRQASPQDPLVFAPHYDTRYIGVSVDGRWIATGSHWGTNVKIWDVAQGTLAHELPIQAGSDVAFSANGKWLATTGEGGRIWSVETWLAGPSLGGVGHVAFSPDGRLLAACSDYGSIRLIDPATGDEFARLDDPAQNRVKWLCFSADSSQLVAVNSAIHSVVVWDLRTLRAELSRMDLDWDLPPYSPLKADDERPLRIEVNQGPPAQE